MTRATGAPPLFTTSPLPMVTLPPSATEPSLTVAVGEERLCLVEELQITLEVRLPIAEQRFGLNDGRKRSYREVGEELGVTAEAARRLVKRAVGTVREEAGTRGAA